MPAWPAGDSPASRPLTYPGAEPPADCLLYGQVMASLSPARFADEPHHWVTDPGTYAAAAVPLDDVLGELDAAPMSGRTPVLAVGSNRCPGQLAAKLAEPARPALGVVPMTRVTVDGLGVALSAHIGRWGYVPWAPAGRPGRHPHWLTWLDVAQLEVVNATEPNYRLVTAPMYTAVIDGIPRADPGRWVVYRSRWGALAVPPSPSGGMTPALPQPEIWGRLLGLPWFRDLVPAATRSPASLAEVFAADEDLRTVVRDQLAARGCAADDQLGDDCEEVRPAAV